MISHSLQKTFQIRSRIKFNKNIFSNLYSSNASNNSLRLIDIIIDDVPIQVPQGITLIQAAEHAGIQIPRFCYHERLAVAGNCRMCLVEIEKVPKPVASCAWPISPGMKVKTSSEMVKKAREGVMEFLLANHPLDCPICDQGGECDLQDQSMVFGSDRSRIIAPKRAVEDKDFGPLVKTTMTRCIHCTRCVRFANEVAGAYELGTSGRGNDMQIGTYIDKPINSELSGNIIDLCPVGALTSKPYAFMARPWELKKTSSIDVMDAMGSAIRIDSRGLVAMRILPRVKDDINEEWLSDKSRFAVDALSKQRLVKPLLKNSEGSFDAVTWEEALLVAAAEFKKANQSIEAIAGSFADVESLVALKDLLASLDVHNLRFDGLSLHSFEPNLKTFRENYLFNSSIQGIDNAKPDSILIIGSNPRFEAPLLSARIRKLWLNSPDISIGLIGERVDLTYGYEYLGDSLKEISDLRDLNNSDFAKSFFQAKRPMIIVGSSVFENAMSTLYLKEIQKLALKSNVLTENWNGFNILQKEASRAGALEIGWSGIPRNPKENASKLIYLLNADNLQKQDIGNSSFVIYQGHTGEVGAELANLILPGSAYTEKSATFVNLEGRSQRTTAAVPAPGAAKLDWNIIRAISEFIGVPLKYDSEVGMRERLYELSPTLLVYDEPVVKKYSFEIAKLALNNLSTKRPKSMNEPAMVPPLKSSIKDFYLTDAISRISPTMAKCSATFSKK